MTVIKDLQYTVGEDCTGGGGEEDTEAPTSFTASLGDITYSSVQLLLNGLDNSGVVIYEITYGETTKVVSGVSGVEKAYIVPDLLSGRAYQFSIIAHDVAGNMAANNPQIINATTVQRATECRGSKGHFGTPLITKINFDISTAASGDVTVKLSATDPIRKILFAELQTTKGNFAFTISEDGYSANAIITGAATNEEIGIRFLYRLDDMPGNEMTSETVQLSDANIVYYIVGDNCGYTSIPEDITKDKAVVVGPNPVKDELTVKSNTGIKRITIYSTVGQIVDQFDAKGLLETTLHVGKLVPSTYIVIVTNSDNSTSAHKVIKQ